MKPSPRLFKIEQPALRPINWGDIVVLVGVAVLVYAGVRLALDAPVVIKGPMISLSPGALPWYASLSIGRMVAAYALAMLFTLLYGSLAANNRRAEKILIPLLDVLQGIPILSFLPVVLLGFSAILPGKMAAELASIVLIFTSQVWNLTFAWYQSLTTIPGELREASAVFRFNTWLRFKTLELPFAAISLIWNSMMSWAGGWFFLMAAETFTVGHRDFRLPGLGAYLQEAANQGNLQAIAWGIGTLVLVIIILDQLVWRPLLAWADRFKLEMAGGENPPASWLYDALRSSRLIDWLTQATWHPARERLDAWLLRRFSLRGETDPAKTIPLWPLYVVGTVGGMGLLYGAFQAGQMLLAVPPEPMEHHRHRRDGHAATRAGRPDDRPGLDCASGRGHRQ
ncbi:MAG: ABC transporter permease subunit [Desulfovibrionales bacterium]|nr:ABC transporter permease subunit [Desulfovibrionales bacterium]